jgi:hypothetical protein
MEVYHMQQILTPEQERVLAAGSAAWHQRIARTAQEAARLKAAHRYFQRTTYRPPFRKEEMEEPTTAGWWL